MATIIGVLLLSPVLQASEPNPLLGCWQCSSDGSKMALRFDMAHYFIEDEPLAYRHVPGFIEIAEPDGYSRYPYSIDNGVLTIHMEDTLPLICQRSSCPGAK
ncbi:MAG TPA: hypothetical protein VGE50_08305 [Gammaproteobacteria bacterium]